MKKTRIYSFHVPGTEGSVWLRTEGTSVTAKFGDSDFDSGEGYAVRTFAGETIKDAIWAMVCDFVDYDFDDRRVVILNRLLEEISSKLTFEEKLDYLNKIESKYESIFLAIDSDKEIESAITSPQYRGIGFRHYGDDKGGYFGLVFLKPIKGAYGELDDIDVPDAFIQIRFLPGGNFEPGSKHFFKCGDTSFLMKYMAKVHVEQVFDHIHTLIDKVELRLKQVHLRK